MACLVLIAYPDELDGRVRLLAGEKPTGESLAAAVRAFLVKHQPWLAARVEVKPGKGHVIIVPREVAPVALRKGERPDDVLRAVEGVLGMLSKLPEVGDARDLPEIDAGEEWFDLPEPIENEEEYRVGLLRSKVRYFPLPGAEWFEICEGHLVLTRESIVFEPRYFLSEYVGERTARGHEIPLGDVTRVGRDTWVQIPCLRVETERRAHRYGWPPKRENIWSNFDLEEWLVALESTLARRKRD